MPVRFDVVHDYLNSKSFKKAHEWYSFDFSIFSPHIVQDKNNEKRLFCKLSKKSLNKIPEEVHNHVNGKRFKRLLQEFNMKGASKEVDDESESGHAEMLGENEGEGEGEGEGDDFADLLGEDEDEDMEVDQEDEDNEEEEDVEPHVPAAEQPKRSMSRRKEAVGGKRRVSTGPTAATGSKKAREGTHEVKSASPAPVSTKLRKAKSSSKSRVREG